MASAGTMYLKDDILMGLLTVDSGSANVNTNTIVRQPKQMATRVTLDGLMDRAFESCCTRDGGWPLTAGVSNLVVP